MAYVDHCKAPRYAVKWRHTVRVGDAPCGKPTPVHQHAPAMPTLAIAERYADLVSALGNGSPPGDEVLIAARLPMLATGDRRTRASLGLPSPIRTEADLRAAAEIIEGARPREDWTVYELTVMYLARMLDLPDRPEAESMVGYFSKLGNVEGTEFGDMRTVDATGADGLAWQHWLATRPKKGRRGPLAPSSIRALRRATVDPALAWATKRGPRREPRIIDESPMDYVPMPDQVEVERDTIRTSEEARDVLALAWERCAAFGELVRLLLFTGLRYNEAISLRCGDLRLIEHQGNAYPMLEKRMRWNQTEGVRAGGKSQAARREIPLTMDQYERLLALTVGRPWDAPLLQGPAGGLWRKHAYNRRWKWVTRDYNRRRPGQQPRHWTGHSLRHFYNSLIRNTGTFDAVVVSKVVGHSPKSDVAKVYTRAELETRARMAQVPVDFLSAVSAT